MEKNKYRDKYRLKDWYLIKDQFLKHEEPIFKPGMRLSGYVYGNPFFKEGCWISTSPIQFVVDYEDHRDVYTENSCYQIYPDEINEKYLNTYPDAYERINEESFHLEEIYE